jgi:adenylate cyclase
MRVRDEKRGINVGDIIIDRGDIFGDGVNVAARLEGLAKPGGMVSTAFDQAKRFGDAGVVALNPQRL